LLSEVYEKEIIIRKHLQHPAIIEVRVKVDVNLALI
jgi:hypothetical protein